VSLEAKNSVEFEVAPAERFPSWGVHLKNLEVHFEITKMKLLMESDLFISSTEQLDTKDGGYRNTTRSHHRKHPADRSMKLKQLCVPSYCSLPLISFSVTAVMIHPL